MSFDHSLIKKLIQDLPESSPIDWVSRIESIHIPVVSGDLKNEELRDSKIYLAFDATHLSLDQLNNGRHFIQNHLSTQLNLLKENIYINFSGMEIPKPTHSPHQNSAHIKRDINHVKNIVLVASGKGGVGKSTTSLNLALALAEKGLSIGLLDADIYGPSLSKMTNVYDKPDVTSDKKIIPIHRYNLEMMSMSFLIDEKLPVIWRGPMVQNALQQLLFEVSWGQKNTLDYLIIDTPPGTGDVHLTLAQSLNIKGAIIVSTPQDIALIDALKAYEMFKKVHIPILGVIENMAYFCCPNCSTQTNIFNTNGAKDFALENNLPYLGEIPLTPNIRIACDQGNPTLHDEYINIAKKFLDYDNVK